MRTRTAHAATRGALRAAHVHACGSGWHTLLHARLLICATVEGRGEAACSLPECVDKHWLHAYPRPQVHSRLDASPSPPPHIHPSLELPRARNPCNAESWFPACMGLDQLRMGVPSLHSTGSSSKRRLERRSRPREGKRPRERPPRPSSRRRRKPRPSRRRWRRRGPRRAPG